MPAYRRSRPGIAALFLGLATYMGLEAFYPPQEQLSARAAVAAIDLYRATLSGAFHAIGGRCKFRPSCSEYGRQCFRKYGALSGGARTLARLWRCAPWGPPPGEDRP
ncbi:MAG: membrane protein insertion efficiency factor YidD [Planctomycetes bacterium]|nr:membrane protein insertion efficiency factor YidD [Planctomycetota bacterium]